jgi:Cu/Zn superoxide dismutase
VTTPTAAPPPAHIVSSNFQNPPTPSTNTDFRVLVNPAKVNHGAPSDEVRHVGDLGNYKTDGQGNAQGSVTDKLIKLIGPQSVIGVSLPVSSG